MSAALEKPLSPKQQRFVDEYLVDLNATKAYVRAGYSATGAEQGASRLLSLVKVQRAVASRQKAQVADSALSASRILEELRRLALVDVRDFFTPEGKLKPIKDLTPEQGACLASFEVIIKNAEAGDGVTDTVHKIRLWSKEKALEMLAKHFALLTEVVRVEEQQTLELRLVAGRQRVAEARARRLQLPPGRTEDT